MEKQEKQSVEPLVDAKLFALGETVFFQKASFARTSRGEWMRVVKLVKGVITGMRKAQDHFQVQLDEGDVEVLGKDGQPVHVQDPNFWVIEDAVFSSEEAALTAYTGDL